MGGFDSGRDQILIVAGACFKIIPARKKQRKAGKVVSRLEKLLFHEFPLYLMRNRGSGNYGWGADFFGSDAQNVFIMNILCNLAR